MLQKPRPLRFIPELLIRSCSAGGKAASEQALLPRLGWYHIYNVVERE